MGLFSGSGDALSRLAERAQGVASDQDVVDRQNQLDQMKKHDVTQGVGLSEATLELANKQGNRTAEDIAGGLTAGTEAPSSLINPSQSQQTNTALGMGNDDAMNHALTNRFQKNFARESKAIKSNAMLKAQDIKSQNLATQQQALQEQQKLIRESKTRNQMKEQGDKMQRNAVLGSVFGGAGAVLGTVAGNVL